ncbi:O-antigen ligase family protein [Sphingobium sp. CAP-1]|uniref:O-antigen ligase family protein n=1 Tax=Sphingobium sp. CAP-1 TaxID=2676077 RepID=UPI001E418E1C|nr:O-antigen ligase family protein [Sphingobium sp. CAP-1]
MILLYLMLFAAAGMAGVAIAMTPTARMSIFVVPIALLGALIIWLLPEGATPPTRFMRQMFFAYFVAVVIWPYYIAIDVPGFPLIEIRRAFLALAVLMLTISVSVSKDFRNELAGIFRASPHFFKFFAGFLIIQLLSLALARDYQSAISLWVKDQLGWTAVLLMAAYIFSRPGAILTWAAIFRTMAIFLACMAFAEYKNQALLWMDHIPSFLTISDKELVVRSLTPHFRDGQYRVMGPFIVSLSFAEWMALTTPFFLYYILFGKNLVLKAICLSADILLLFAVDLTQARVGLVGMLVTHTLFIAAWALRARARGGNTLLPTAVLAAYPAIFCAIVVAVMTIDRFRISVLGGGTQAASDQGRREQMMLAIPKIMQRPINGYGVGQAPQALGWTNPQGDISIDSYALTLLLDYGIIGFICYIGMVGTAITQGFKLGMSANSEEGGYALAAGVTLCAWLVCQTVLSQEDNASLAFMIMAIVVALAYRRSKSEENPSYASQLPSG